MYHENLSQTWELVCKKTQLPKLASAARFIVSGIAVAIVQDSFGVFHAISDICSHGDISLSEGFVEGCFIECIGHGSRFDLKTGVPQELPAYEAIVVYPMKIENSNVYIDVSAKVNKG